MVFPWFSQFGKIRLLSWASRRRWSSTATSWPDSSALTSTRQSAQCEGKLTQWMDHSMTNGPTVCCVSLATCWTWQSNLSVDWILAVMKYKALLNTSNQPEMRNRQSGLPFAPRTPLQSRIGKTKLSSSLLEVGDLQSSPPCLCGQYWTLQAPLQLGCETSPAIKNSIQVGGWVWPIGWLLVFWLGWLTYFFSKKNSIGAAVDSNPRQSPSSQQDNTSQVTVAVSKTRRNVQTLAPQLQDWIYAALLHEVCHMPQYA